MSGSSAGDLVSVVIATYNMGRYLPQAVQSVLGQSYANVDLQIVDDGSTDDTPAILRRWDGHPRVRLYSQANAGKARAMNQGVALSGGSFIAFLDADDVWLPEKLSRQMPLFAARSEVGVVYCDYERMDGAGGPLPKGPTARYRIWAGQMSKDYRQRYKSGIRIMQNFLARNPGTVEQAVVRSAWAHTYTGRGNVLLWREKDRRAALRDYLRALSFRPAYWPAWPAMLRSLVTTRAPWWGPSPGSGRDPLRILPLLPTRGRLR